MNLIHIIDCYYWIWIQSAIDNERCLWLWGSNANVNYGKIYSRPSTSGVETSKHAGHMFAIYGCTTPKKSQWLPLTHTSLFYGAELYVWAFVEPAGCLGCQEKAGPLSWNIGPWGPHPSKRDACYHCGCRNDQYLSPYWTIAKWLPRLLRKSRQFIFKYRPLGPASLNIWGMFTYVDV